jgi:hypothetical protein
MFLRTWSAMIAFMTCFYFAGSAVATPPANDNCANATTITSNAFDDSVDISDAPRDRLCGRYADPVYVRDSGRPDPHRSRRCERERSGR